MKKRLKELAELVGGSVAGDGDIIVSGVAGIETAREGDITFIANPKYKRMLLTSQASAIISDSPVQGKPTLITPNPYLAFARILELYHPTIIEEEGIDPTTIVSPDACIEDGVWISSHVYIGKGTRIGKRVKIFPGVYIGNGVEIGDDTIIHANVSIREGTRIGKRVMIHCNSVIGSDGFGFAKDGTRYVKVPQVGRVRIEDDVEIGACVTIDRATMGETVIGRGTKIDNLVQIAHNVEIGEDSLIIAQVGISGSTRIGNRVTLAGQVGVVGHITVGDDSKIGAQSGVINDVPSEKVYTGTPAIPHRDWQKIQALLKRLPEMRREIIALKEEISHLKEGKG